MDVRKLLEDWNCEASVIKTFVEDNKFDEESFLLLDAATIESLIPEKGPLLKFKHKYQALLQSVAKLNGPLQFSEKVTHHIFDENLAKEAWIHENCNSHLAKDPLYQEENFENCGPIKRQRLSLDAEEIEIEKADFIILDSQLEHPYREKVTHGESPDITAESSTALFESSQFSQEKPNSNQKSTLHIQSRVLNPISVGNKRLFDERPEEPTIFPHGLKAFLEKDVDGSIALKSGDTLDKRSRSYLVKAVVNYLFRLFSRKNLIDKEIFIRAAREINLAYPTESEKTYFIVGKPKTKTSARTLHKGKLYSRYINVKHALGGIAKNDENATEDQGASDTELEEDAEKLVERSTALQYLKKSVGSPSEQANNWKICIKDRSDLLENHTIYEYFRLFPILRTQFGYELLMQDFNRMYQAQKDALYTIWDPLARAITVLCIGRGVISPEVAKNSNEIEDAFLVKYMPLLFHPGTVKNVKTKKNFRPSNDEMIETFFLHVHDHTHIDYEVKRRKEIINNRGDTLQPFILAVGYDLHNLTAIYVYIDGMRYKMETVVQALDVCFKSFHALTANYPSTGQQVWNFVQRYVYKIYTPYDIDSSSQAEVAAELCATEPSLKELLWDGKKKHKKVHTASKLLPK